MKLLPGRPYVTRDPVLVVDPTLAPGTYHFQLVVENGQGQRSPPAEVAIVVRRPERRWEPGTGAPGP